MWLPQPFSPARLLARMEPKPHSEPGKRLQRLVTLPPGSQEGFPVRRDRIRPWTFLSPALRLQRSCLSSGRKMVTKMIRRNMRESAQRHFRSYDSPRALLLGNRVNLPHQAVDKREFVHNSPFTL